MTWCGLITTSILWFLQCDKAIALLEPSGYNVGDIAESDIFQILNTKDYIPNENDLPKPAVLKSVDNDATYILSKLSDEELINLLTKEPKKNDFNLNDLAKIAGSAGTKVAKPSPMYDQQVFSGKEDTQKAYFKLNDREVEPFNFNSEADPKYNAYQKLSNLLYSRPQEQNSDEDSEKAEMLFDVLVTQLKSICCKKIRPKDNAVSKLKSLLKKVIFQKKTNSYSKNISPKSTEKPTEHIFLVINDEIRIENDTDDLIAVDPNSLSINSSVLLLGPITTPLSKVQLKLVMTRITNELSKPEYLPLLQKISEGAAGSSNLGIMNSLVTGPDSRRYIKPHRCNHQSKLAKVYGGPKWIICTGYLNVNNPSLYD